MANIATKTESQAPERIKAPAKGIPVAGIQPREKNAKGKFVPRIKPPETEVVDETEAVLGGGKKRIPLGQHVAQLGYPPRPGFHRRWVSELPGRVDRALAAGWSHVKDPRSKQPVRLVVDKSLGERGRNGFLMEIPQALYDEDQEVKSRSLDEVDEHIYKGTFNQEDNDKRYNPTFAPNKNEVRRGSGKV